MKGKKWRDVRNALVMVIVMVAMMSSATFAWFTLTSSPTVTGLQMTAAASQGLKISETSGGDYYDAVDISDSTGTNQNENNNILSPVSVTKAAGETSYKPLFYEPVYLGNTVTSLKSTALNATDTTKLKGYVAKYEYYLKSDADTEWVGIVTAPETSQSGNIGITNNKANIPGSFVRQNSSATNTFTAINAVRIGFVVGSETKMYIYEPNNESTTTTGTYATNNVPAPTSDVVSTVDTGIITTGKGADDYTSKGLFQVSKAGTKITMYVWLEGTDDDCVDEIQKDIIEAQIQFTIAEAPTT